MRILEGVGIVWALMIHYRVEYVGVFNFHSTQPPNNFKIYWNIVVEMAGEGRGDI